LQKTGALGGVVAETDIWRTERRPKRADEAELLGIEDE
jgi:hypothetical protein